MFDSITITFSLLALSMIMMPGPNFVLVCHITASAGLSVGVAAIAGIGVASLMHGTLTLMGVTVLISNSRTLYLTLQLAGSFYLCYLGLNALHLAWKHKTAAKMQQAGSAVISYSLGFRRGLVSNLLNPYSTVFYLVVYPQILDMSKPQDNATLALLVALGFVLHATWFSCVALCIDKARNSVASAGSDRCLHFLSGGVLLGLGVSFFAQTITM